MELEDFQGGFLGAQGEGGAMDLLKAMQAGQITGRDTANQTLTMEPLKAESLETTLKVLTHRQKDIKLLNAIPKMTAYNTVEEFLQLQSYGIERGGFYNEGELSDTEDSQYVRRAEKIKYLQITGEITMQAQMVKSFINAMTKEVENKAMWITRKANISMTKGNSDIIPQEWNGLYKQHANIGITDGALYTSIEDYYTNSGVVIDLRGKSLKQSHVEDGAVAVDSNYGNVSDLFAPTTVISALSKDYYDKQRILQNGVAQEYNYGVVPKAISTTLGDVSLNSDKFMELGKGFTIAGKAADPKAPAAPTAGTNPALAVDTLAKFQAGETGLVRYAVTAVNRFGESGLTLLGAADIAVTVGSAIDLVFSATAGAQTATGFKIYRTKPGQPYTSTFYPLFTVSTAELAAGYDGGAPTVIRDRGRILPDTESAFVTEMVDDVLSFKQLAPISKLDLAVISMSRRFITFMFATPNLYTPKKFVKYVNCAKTYVA
jgi:hypothetical protein